MIKFRIHGRGGQGGVTLAKVLAFMYWTEGKWVQAFGNYSAERTGAPILAFCLVDEQEITNRSKVYYPDHIIILDPTLLGAGVLEGLQPNAYVVIDSPEPPDHYRGFAGHRVVTVDAKSIALKYKLGTKSVPITNTALAGALARVFDLSFEVVGKTIQALGLPSVNLQAAKEAYEMVRIGKTQPGEPKRYPVLEPKEPVPSLITGNLGVEPQLNVADWKSQEPYFAKDRVAPCNFHCPAGNDIRAFISELTKGNYDKALAIIRETSPLPGVTSRVCPHPCEEFCNRKELDEKINIHELERLAADRGRVSAVRPSRERKEKVLVVGSGPAGLSAAYHLRRQGYQTSIVEALPKPGGMLYSGIPEYRLPEEVLQKEIQYIRDTGVDIKCNFKIQSRDDFTQLVEQYHAVVVAAGLSVGQNIKLNFEADARVLQGIEFLRQVNSGERVDLGAKVIIIGGGNTAIDASRTALRLGSAEVSIVYRRSREEMPAIREEIEAALAEGVKLKFLFSPSETFTRNGRYFLKAQKMRLGDPDASGRRKPIPVTDSFEEIEFTTLILATGQVAETTFLAGLVEMADGLVKTDADGRTSHPKIFACGDVATNAGTVTHAIGHGRRVALAVDARLSGAATTLSEYRESNVVTPEQMNLFYFDPKARDRGKEHPANRRVKNFDEVNLGLAGAEEALRCLSCGMCNGCQSFERGKCELFCPERTIYRISATQLDINYEGCKGCLICTEVCPRHAIDKRTVKKGEESSR